MGKSKELATFTDAGGTIDGALNINGNNSKISASNNHLILHDTAETDTGSNWWYIYRNSGQAGALSFYRGVERMRIDGSGRVTMPYQPHIFGTPGMGSSGGSGAANRMTVASSSGGMTFGSSGVTVPVGGVYMITFTTISINGSGRVDSYVKINGVLRMTGLNNASDNGASDYRMRTMTGAIKLAANDLISFEHDAWYNHGNSFTNWQTASVTLLG